MATNDEEQAAAGRSGTIMDVEHVVILTQENRSFDHYFGTMRGVRGFGDRFPIPSPPTSGGGPRNVWRQLNLASPEGPVELRPFHLDTQASFSVLRVRGTPHLWPDAQGAWNQGKLDHWPTYKQNHSMGYFAEADLPFQFALAELFTVCDAYHCSFMGGTNPNRVFAWTGTNGPSGKDGGPVMGNSYDHLGFDPGGGYAWSTYAERLQQAGVRWQVYQDMADNYTDNPLVGFRSFRAAAAGEPGADPALRERALSTRDIAQLKRDVEAGQLPQVSFIVATADGSEHPGPSSPAQGADYTAAVLDALTSNPEVWRRTVFFLMFDENDGFFDHVPPPAVPSYLHWSADPAQAELAGASTVSTEGEYHEHRSQETIESEALMHHPYGLGPRVPMLVISPWSRGGWVNSQVFDHTSVIRFLETRFGVMEPNISAWRRAVCGDMTSAFDFTQPDDSAFMDQLPATGQRAAMARQVKGTVLPAAADTFLPLQQPGVRPSRALPYVLSVTDLVQADGSTVRLTFLNAGAGAAVFHVYDQQRLDLTPRRYTVEPGRTLEGSWPLGMEGYDLWVLGPNGFHRHIAGQEAGWAAVPEVRMVQEPGDGGVAVVLRNHGALAASFSIASNAYGIPADETLIVAPGEQTTQRWSLAASSGWYDFSVSVAESPGYVRRFAGRMETGQHSISDPAMGNTSSNMLASASFF